MNYLGNIPAGIVLYVPFDTFNAAGASVTMTGLATTDIKIYKNGGTTERASQAGYTLLDTDGIDFDGITGIHGFSIDLADNTTAGFFSVGGFYWIVIDTVTVDSQVIKFIAASFRIVQAEATAGYPSVNAALVGNASPETAAVIAAATWDLDATGHQTQGTFGQAIGDPVADTNTIFKAVVTDGTNATVGLDTAALLTAVNVIDDFLDTEIAAIVTATGAAAIRTALGLASANLDTQLGTIDDFLDTEVAAIKAKTDLIPGTQDGRTFAEVMLLIASAILSKRSGMATTTGVIRALDDSQDRITATMDADGNRTAVTFDVTSP